MSALAPMAIRQLPQVSSPLKGPTQLATSVAEGAEYRAIFGAGGVVAQAKEGFIAARFSPSQPLRIKRSPGLRALQSTPLPEPSNTFSYVMPWEPETLAA